MLPLHYPQEGTPEARLPGPGTPRPMSWFSLKFGSAKSQWEQADRRHKACRAMRRARCSTLPEAGWRFGIEPWRALLFCPQRANL